VYLSFQLLLFVLMICVFILMVCFVIAQLIVYFVYYSFFYRGSSPRVGISQDDIEKYTSLKTFTSSAPLNDISNDHDGGALYSPVPHRNNNNNNSSSDRSFYIPPDNAMFVILLFSSPSSLIIYILQNHCFSHYNIFTNVHW
jgi:hypothetical protein